MVITAWATMLSIAGAVLVVLWASWSVRSSRLWSLAWSVTMAFALVGMEMARLWMERAQEWEGAYWRDTAILRRNLESVLQQSKSRGRILQLCACSVHPSSLVQSQVRELSFQCDLLWRDGEDQTVGVWFLPRRNTPDTSATPFLAGWKSCRVSWPFRIRETVQCRTQKAIPADRACNFNNESEATPCYFI